jgi:hypothetical protein
MRPTPYELSSWPRLLWLSFRGVLGTFLGVAGLGAGVAAWFIPASEKVSLALYVVTLLLALAVVLILAEATRIARASAAHPLPRVRFSLDESSDPEDPRIVLVLEGSPLFSHGMLVSAFFIQEDQYERFFAQGVVQNIQDDALIQVRLTQFSESFADIAADLRSSKTHTLTRLRVKPYVQQRTEWRQEVVQ